MAINVTANVTPLAVIQVKPGIGDVIWHLPFIRAIAAAAPDWQVTFFAPRQARPRICLPRSRVWPPRFIFSMPDRNCSAASTWFGWLRCCAGIARNRFGFSTAPSGRFTSDRQCLQSIADRSGRAVAPCRSVRRPELGAAQPRRRRRHRRLRPVRLDAGFDLFEIHPRHRAGGRSCPWRHGADHTSAGTRAARALSGAAESIGINRSASVALRY
jgi:hypothetical protein